MLRTIPLKTGRPKNKPELKTLTSEQIRASSANCPEDSPSRKGLGGRWLRKTA